METIWQHDVVLPYILNELKEKIEAITPIHKIVLYGSRARTPFNDWESLKGKDWDIIVVCNFPITNTHIWTKDLGYHIDLTVTTKDRIAHFEQYNMTYLELFPNNELVMTKT
ncbi:MAG: nucleotidyltransferase domain-containing protein [Flavobacterium sp.]|nr:nucleotidyltransferase domain-containing protein [Flavobacterium sp.]